MHYYTTLDLIGQTPLVKLTKLSTKYNVNFYLKLESHNLTGSIKDRTALRMIKEAEKNGLLKPGMTIIESSSGNLGTAMSAICAYKGYKFICVIDPKTSNAKINAIKAYGGEIYRITKKSKSGGYVETRIGAVKKLLKTIPDSINLDQYNNPINVTTHYESTGPEIYNALDGKIDAIVGSLSTSGTMMGVAKFFKERKVPSLTVGVEPIGSVLFGGKYMPYLLQGPGISFFPRIYTSELLDIKIKVGDQNAFNTSKLLATTEGLLVGGSTGAAVFAAIELIKKRKTLKEVVIIAPDNGERYLDTFFSEQWLKKKNLLSSCPR